MKKQKNSTHLRDGTIDVCPNSRVRSSTKNRRLGRTLLTPKSVNDKLNTKIQRCWETPSQPKPVVLSKVRIVRTMRRERTKCMRQKKKVKHTYETVTTATWTQRRYDRSLSSISGTKIPRRVLSLALSRVTGRAQTIAVKGR